MTSFQLSVPSKTFILGEYVVLQEGPAIVLTTSPRFRLIAEKQTQNKINVDGIHLESPAGKLIQHNANFFQRYHITFIDSHQGLGGFGASSAQFVMAAAFKEYANGKTIDDLELLKKYKQFAWDGEGMPPSGVDLIAQLHGGVCFYHKLKNQLKIFSWPFIDLEYCLIHTGNKLATHLHLKQLSQLNTADFEDIVQMGLMSFEQKNSLNFIAAIRNYANLLQEKNLVADETQKIIKTISVNPDILAVKGCGALGADVILVIFNIKTRDQTLSWLKENKLNIINYGNQVANGLEVQEIQTQ